MVSGGGAMMLLTTLARMCRSRNNGEFEMMVMRQRLTWIDDRPLCSHLSLCTRGFTRSPTIEGVNDVGIWMLESSLRFCLQFLRSQELRGPTLEVPDKILLRLAGPVRLNLSAVPF